MTDIVERLRSRREMVDMGHGNVIDVPDEDCVEAANEIERLNAARRVDGQRMVRMADEYEARQNEVDQLRIELELWKARAYAEGFVLAKEGKT
jgi:hypothetical protein